MNILPVQYNIFNFNKVQDKKTEYTTPVCFQPLKADTVSFKGLNAGSKPLKALVRYGVYDIYTGLRLLDPKYVEKLIQKGMFNQPLEKVMPILKKQEDTMLPTAKKVLELISEYSKNNPNRNLQDALRSLRPKYEKNLVDTQKEVFDELTELMCDVPEKLQKEFKDLMYVTDLKMNRAAVETPFSKKTLIYKLKQVREDLIKKNKQMDIISINAMIQMANAIFEDTSPKLKEITTRKTIREKKLEYQLQPQILKENLRKIKALRKLLNKSSLQNNKELIKILNKTSDSIRGYPIKSPFKSQEFIYNLKRITKYIEDKQLAAKIMRAAHKLPSSAENVAAFIVKYADESPAKIGFCLLKEGIASVDHLNAKKNGGANKLMNFGLCSTYINTKKSNIPFDVWCRNHPETYKNCQKSVDRLVELYNDGIFKKVGLSRKYIIDFVNTIEKLSPKEKPIILNIDNLMS